MTKTMTLRCADCNRETEHRFILSRRGVALWKCGTDGCGRIQEGDSIMRLELKDLQDAYDVYQTLSRPLYLLKMHRVKMHRGRFWSRQEPNDLDEFGVEVLAIAERARKKMTGIQILRADGRVEQQCVHGVGHTISSPSRGKYALTHGCDFCCEELRQQ